MEILTIITSILVVFLTILNFFLIKEIKSLKNGKGDNSEIKDFIKQNIDKQIEFSEHFNKMFLENIKNYNETVQNSKNKNFVFWKTGLKKF